MTQRNKPGRVLLLIAFLCCAAALGFLMLNKYHDRIQPPVPSATPGAETAPPRMVTLFFATPDGSGLARESREIDACNVQVDCIKDIIGELLNGPLGDLEPTLPQGVINGVTVTKGIAVIDLGQEFAAGLSGRNSAAPLAVYSIVNSITVNIPEITGVQFLIDGKESAALKSNPDARTPLTPDFSLEKKPAAAGAGTETTVNNPKK